MTQLVLAPITACNPEKFEAISFSIEELLQCPICFENKPVLKILKYCGHYFCLKCLQELYSKKAAGLIICPFCSYGTKLVVSGLFGRKKVPKADQLGKLLADCRTLKLLHHLFYSGRSLNRLKASLVSRLTVCRVCRNRLENHRMLPFCQHSYCLPCLNDLYMKENAERKVRGVIHCPICQCPVVFVSNKKDNPPPPASLISRLLPVDYALSTLLNTI